MDIWSVIDHAGSIVTLISFPTAVAGISLYQLWRHDKMSSFKRWLPRILLIIAALAYIGDIADRFRLGSAKEGVRPTANIRLFYTHNPVKSEIMARENIATKYTFAFLQDGTTTSDTGKGISWSDIVVVFRPAVTARSVRARFESGPELIYTLITIDPHLAIVRFEGSLADKVIDLEFY